MNEAYASLAVCHCQRHPTVSVFMPQFNAAVKVRAPRRKVLKRDVEHAVDRHPAIHRAFKMIREPTRRYEAESRMGDEDKRRFC